MQNPLAAELAQIKSPDDCIHCGRDVWFDDEDELFISDTIHPEDERYGSSGVWCDAAPADSWGQQLHDIA